jgi:hypothetical protein
VYSSALTSADSSRDATSQRRHPLPALSAAAQRLRSCAHAIEAAGWLAARSKAARRPRPALSRALQRLRGALQHAPPRAVRARCRPPAAPAPGADVELAHA